MTELNELFEQILYSERKFKARNDELRLVTVEVEQCQLCIQEIREEIHTKQGELAVKRNKLADQDVETKILQIRKEILTNQVDILFREKQKISDHVLEAEKKQDSNRVTFIDQLNTFSQYYDLLGSGCKQRDERLKKKISLLQEELLLLETELVEIRCQQEEVNKLESALAETSNNLAIANRELDEIAKAEKETQNETMSLELKNNSMDKTLSQEPEFARLQRELESCKVSTDEATCKQLSKEFDDLQRQCYHKQMRQQLSSKGAPLNSVVCSARKSGHYNPYTLRYVPAPNNEEPPLSSVDMNEDSTDSHVVVGPGDGGSDSNDGDSIPEWDMDIDEDDSFLAEYKDQQELNTCLRGDSQGISWSKQLPPSNFCAIANKSTASASTSCSEFTQAGSILRKRGTPVPTIGTRRSKPAASSKKSVATTPFQKQNKSLSAPPLDSPEPQLTRKRQGESIVKAAVPQESSLPRRAKKVRFHY